MKSRKIIFTTVLSALVCFGLLPGAKAVEPATPDPGSVSLSNTADGDLALAGLGAGIYNSAFGFYALLSNADANFNTGVGAGVLLVNTASENTAVGAGALFSNADGGDNNAFGTFALFNNVSGFFNNAHGRNALLNNVDGSQNNAMGDDAMENNTSGSFNTAVGDDALFSCTTGSSNVAVGDEAGNSILDSTDNVVVGAGAGTNIVSLGGNIYIGSGAGGSTDEVAFIRIGVPTILGFPYDTYIAGINGRGVDLGTAALVYADANQKIGTVLVDANGNTVPFKPQAMLDESLKQQKRIAELEGMVTRLAATVKEQTAQIQKVSAQLEVIKPAPQVVANKP